MPVPTQIDAKLLQEALERVFRGEPFLFPGESSTPSGGGGGGGGGPISAALVRPWKLSQAVGPAKSLGELDWIAFTADEPSRTGDKTCSYEDRDTRRKFSQTVKLLDQRVTIFDRRTAKEVGSVVVPAPDRCPSSARYSADVTSRPDDADLLAALANRTKS